MILDLVTPPAAEVVATADLCEQLRVTSTDEIALIERYQAAAVAYLDGWRGVLGRPIGEQTWRQQFCGFGTLRLALPDVAATGLEVTAVDDEGNAVVPTKAVLKRDAVGWYVETTGPTAEEVYVTFSCALPPGLLPVVKSIVWMLVTHWFENRAVLGESSQAEIPFSARELINTIRWRSVG